MKITGLLITIGLLLLSCRISEPKPPCTNRLSVFNTKEPNTNFYQRLVLKVLSDSKPEDFRYFFKTFHDKNDQVFITLNLRNSVHCFDAMMLVGNMSPFKGGMYRTNGKSYPNELYNVKWKIDSSFKPPLLTFLNMDKIID